MNIAPLQGVGNPFESFGGAVPVGARFGYALRGLGEQQPAGQAATAGGVAGSMFAVNPFAEQLGAKGPEGMQFQQQGQAQMQGEETAPATQRSWPIHHPFRPVGAWAPEWPSSTSAPPGSVARSQRPVRESGSRSGPGTLHDWESLADVEADAAPALANPTWDPRQAQVGDAQMPHSLACS